MHQRRARYAIAKIANLDILAKFLPNWQKLLSGNERVVVVVVVPGVVDGGAVLRPLIGVRVLHLL